MWNTPTSKRKVLTAHQRKNMPVDLLPDAIELLLRDFAVERGRELCGGVDLLLRDGDVHVDVMALLLVRGVAERPFRAHRVVCGGGGGARGSEGARVEAAGVASEPWSPRRLIRRAIRKASISLSA